MSGPNLTKNMRSEVYEEAHRVARFSGVFDHKVLAERTLQALEDIRLLRAALETALPYVEKVASTQPTTATREMRRRQAVRDVASVKMLLDDDPAADAA